MNKIKWEKTINLNFEVYYELSNGKKSIGIRKRGKEDFYICLYNFINNICILKDEIILKENWNLSFLKKELTKIKREILKEVEK